MSRWCQASAVRGCIPNLINPEFDAALNRDSCVTHCVIAAFSKGQDGFCDYLYKVSTKQTPRQSSHSTAQIEGKDNTELDR